MFCELVPKLLFQGVRDVAVGGGGVLVRVECADFGVCGSSCVDSALFEPHKHTTRAPAREWAGNSWCIGAVPERSDFERNANWQLLRGQWNKSW